MDNIPFFPAGAYGTTPDASTFIAATTAVQQVNLPLTPSTQSSMRIVVSGTSKIAWAYGNTSALSMSNGVVMLANTVEIFSVPPGISQLSIIADAAGSNVYITVGDGQ